MNQNIIPIALTTAESRITHVNVVVLNFRLDFDKMNPSSKKTATTNNPCEIQ